MKNVCSRDFVVSPYTNRHLSRQLPEGFRPYALTSDWCSCGLYRHGSAGDERGPNLLTRLRRKYQKKGWSQAKIERAIGDQEHRLRHLEPFVGLRPDVRNLLADTAEQCGELAIIVHFYRGNVENEKITLQPGDRISPSDLREAKTAIGEDTIVWVRRPRPHQALR